MIQIDNLSAEKLRGGFYTPKPIADFLLKWGYYKMPLPKILEPSCGDGIFLQVIKEKNLDYSKITAIEYNKEEYNKSKQIGLKNITIYNEDFHKYCLETEQKFNLIIGNPPYIKFQNFNKEQQKLADSIFTKSKLKYSKLTNAWVSFILFS